MSNSNWLDRLFPGRVARREAQQRQARRISEASRTRTEAVRPKVRDLSTAERQALRARAEQLAAERGTRRTASTDYADLSNPLNPASPLWVGNQPTGAEHHRDHQSPSHQSSSHQSPTHHTPSHTTHTPTHTSHDYGGGHTHVSHDFGGGHHGF